MQALLLVLSLVCVGQSGLAQVKVEARFVPRKEAKERLTPDPTRLNDVARVQVEAQSNSGITKVTFEVDDQFRVEVTKPPFTYDWDTLNENDGPHTLAITAHNTDGQTGIKRLKVKVFNQLNLGVKHFADLTVTAFREGDAEEAIRAARKAVKINRADPLAARAIALAAGLQGDPNRGLQTLDDRQLMIPQNDPITEEVRCYLLLARAAGNADVKAMIADIQTALPLLKRTLNGYVERIKAEYPESATAPDVALKRGDALLSVGQVEAAYTAYRTAGERLTGEAKRRAQLREGLALLRLGRLQEAQDLAQKLTNAKPDDATAAALLGAVLFHRRQYLAAWQAVKEGIAKRNIAALSVAAISDLAIGRRAMAYTEARDALTAADVPETQYVAMAVLADAGNLTASRQAFQSAYLRAPQFTPTLIARALEMMAYEKAEDRFIQARSLLELVLRLEPENPSALAAHLTALIQLKHYKIAEASIAKLSGNDPTAPDLYILRAALYNQNLDQAKKATAALQTANRYDPVNYKDTYVPDMALLAARMLRLRRVIPLTPLLLDFADTPPQREAEADTTTTSR